MPNPKTTKAAPPKQEAKPAVTAAPKVLAPVNPVKPGDVKLDSQMHQSWACFAPAHYTQDMLETPKFWTFMAPKFKDLDAIRITAEDGSFVAFGIIRRTNTLEVNVQIYDWIELQEAMIAKEIEINDYVIKHFGAVRKFCVINKSTKTVMKENFQTQIQAMRYVADHMQVKQATG
ncbi:MAG: hypothetical protein E4H01_13645 [Lysobacterales bacterium]|nr:MAG: hypothetical protein E4H01_13645 [Xanthomonadales bacterium]